MELHLKVTGVLLIALASIHVFFPRYFDWRKDLSAISLINRQMMYVHTFFIALIVLIIGVLCLSSAKELISTKLGNRISLGLAIFWFIRLVIQFYGYSPALWRGKRFETIIHILLSVLWVYLTIVFIVAAITGLEVKHQ